MTPIEIDALMRKLIELEEWSTELVIAGFERDEETRRRVTNLMRNRIAELSNMARRHLGLPSIRQEARGQQEPK